MPKQKIIAEPGKAYLLRGAYSEALTHCGYAGELLLARIERHEDSRGAFFNAEIATLDQPEFWIHGFTFGEIGLFREGDEFYFFAPDWNEKKEDLDANYASALRQLNQVMDEAGAVRITSLGL